MVVLVSGFAWAQQGELESPVAKITSDTAAYCTQLAAAAEAVSMPIDAKLLHDQGVRLCARGYLQAGIARLRRALLMTRDGKAEGN